MTQQTSYQEEISLAQVKSNNSYQNAYLYSVDEYWLVESRNVIIRLTGKSNSTEEAFLVNAHYGK